MNFKNNRKDLTEIIDDRWNARRNAYKTVNEAHQHDRVMNNRLYGNGMDNINNSNTHIDNVSSQINRINDNVNALRNNRNKF